MTHCRASNRFKGTSLQRSSPFDDGMVQQFKHQAKGCQLFFFDGGIIVTFERFRDDCVSLALQG